MVLPKSPGATGNVPQPGFPNPRPQDAPTPPQPQDSSSNDNERRRLGQQAAAASKEAASKAAQSAAQSPDAGAAPAGPYNDTVPPYQNAPLNPLTESTFLYGRDKVSLQRGALVRMADAQSPTFDAIPPTPLAKRYKFRFLFNPESISISSSAFAGMRPPSATTPTGFQNRFVGQETVTFSLMVDRTQEAYNDGVTTRGTLDDIEALYRVCNGPEGSAAGLLYMSYVRIYWAAYGGSLKSTPLQIMEGYISGINIMHTMFTPRMTPIRSTIDVTFSRMTQSVDIPRIGSPNSP